MFAAPPQEKDKPVLIPKKENQGPKQPATPAVGIGGGIVDINANPGGFPAFANPFGPDFEFPALPLPSLERPAGSFGIGGLFGIDEGNKWWKG